MQSVHFELIPEKVKKKKKSRRKMTSQVQTQPVGSSHFSAGSIERVIQQTSQHSINHQQGRADTLQIESSVRRLHSSARQPIQ